MAETESKSSNEGVQIEAITAILTGEDDNEAKAQKLQAAFEESVTRLKMNREDIKREKTEIQDKYRKLEESSHGYVDEIAALKEQLQKNSPEEAKKVFEDEKGRIEAQYKGLLKGKEDEIVGLNTHIKELENYKHEIDCEREFDRVAKDKGILPDSYAEVKQWVLGRHSENFTLRPTGPDEFTFADSEGRTVNNRLEDFLKTNMGKKCVSFNSTGGGAGGGSSANGSKVITFTEFNAKTPAEKAELMRKGYRISQ